jgi:hypothetical protein
METVMVRRKLVNAALVAAAALLPFGLISCSDDSPPGGAGATGGAGGSGGKAGSGGAPSDAGKADATDAPAGDSSGDRMADSGGTLPDGAVPPSGTQLVSGSIGLIGVTSDNYAVYENNVTGTLNVISLAGGTPTMIGASGNRVLVSGSAVVFWTGATRVTALSVWTATSGVKVLGMTSNAFPATVAVSPDGSRILYFDGVDSARISGNLFIAGTDGTGQTLLASSVALTDTSCAPALSFGGNAAAAAAYCIVVPPAPDGGPDGATTDGATTDGATTDGATADGATTDGARDGAPDVGTSDAAGPDTGTTDGGGTDAGPTPMAMVQSFQGPTWTATTLATNVNPRVAVAPTGTTVLVSAPAGLVAYPIAGGAPTIIDAGGGFGMFSNDGLSVFYTTPTNELKRSTVAAPSPITLATSGFAGFRAKSPDEKWVLGFTMRGARADVGDLFLASTSTPGTPTTLNTDLTAGLFGSDGFTADSSHAIYYTDITSDGVGNFFALSPAGGSPVALSTNVWVHYAGTGSKVVFNDNYDGTNADIRLADTARSAPPTVLVSLAGADFYIAGSKDKVVYTWDYLTGSMAGLWATPIP